MLADAFAKVDASRPAIIRLGNILDTQPTSIDIQRGTAPKDTVLGRNVTTASPGAWRPRFPMAAWIGKGQAVDRSDVGISLWQCPAGRRNQAADRQRAFADTSAMRHGLNRAFMNDAKGFLRSHCIEMVWGSLPGRNNQQIFTRGF